MKRGTIGILAVVFLTATACTSMDSGTMPKKTLYDRLGGKPAITTVVDDFIGNVAADTRINGRFQGANIPRLKGMPSSGRWSKTSSSPSTSSRSRPARRTNSSPRWAV